MPIFDDSRAHRFTHLILTGEKMIGRSWTDLWKQIVKQLLAYVCID